MTIQQRLSGSRESANIITKSHQHSESTPINERSIIFSNFNIDNKRTSIISTVLLLFFIVEAVFQLVIPIVEALSRSKYNRLQYFLQIFQYSVSVLVLAYLQSLVTQRCGKCCQSLRKCKIGAHIGLQPINRNERKELQSSLQSIDDARCLSPITADQSVNVRRTNCNDISEKLQTRSDSSLLELHSNEMVAEVNVLTEEQNNRPPLVYYSKGINLYLRLGAVVFGFGVIVMDGFRVADWVNDIRNQADCHSPLYIHANIIHAIYIFLQTYFLFKHHRVIFNVNKVFICFVLSHMTAVNLGQWLCIVLEEIGSKPEGEENHDLNNNNFTSVLSSNGRCHSRMANFTHYLTPCGVEYSLIACAIFWKMFQRIGMSKTETEKVTIVLEEVAEFPSQTNSKQATNECQRSHKGLFGGLLFISVTLVCLTLVNILLSNGRHCIALIIYLTTDLGFLVVGFITVIAALIQLRNLAFRQMEEEDAFDDNLLIVGLLGILFYDLFLVVPAFEAKGEERIIGAIFIARAMLELVQTLLQVFLIIEVSRRQAANHEHVVKKPGRTMITFLLILNLAMWILKTFELKHAGNHPIHNAHYTDLAWRIITRLTLPLVIFFRFHSTVCLADAWSCIYKIHD